MNVRGALAVRGRESRAEVRTLQRLRRLPEFLQRTDLEWIGKRPFIRIGETLHPVITGAVDAYYVTPLPPFAPALGASFASFTTQQDVSPLPLPILLGNSVRPGTLLKIEAEGQWSATGTPTLILGFYGGVPGASGGGTITSVFGISAAQTLSAITDIPWRMEYRCKFITLGTAGSLTGTGSLAIGTSLTALTSVSFPVTLALRTVAFNTTVDNAIGVAATFSASSASNAVRTYSLSALLQN